MCAGKSLKKFENSTERQKKVPRMNRSRNDGIITIESEKRAEEVINQFRS